jgi:hypothetical protein
MTTFDRPLRRSESQGTRDDANGQVVRSLIARKTDRFLTFVFEHERWLLDCCCLAWLRRGGVVPQPICEGVGGYAQVACVNFKTG